MPISSSDFLSSAERCFAEGSEVGYRNTISRAYYALYHEIKENLTCLPAYSRDHHSSLISYLKNKGENKLEPYDPVRLKSMAYKLEQQRLARNEADYDLGSFTIDHALAEQSLLEVKAIFSQWEKMKADEAV
ncbi:hypothetical protein [Klebsiella pasteurii]|uniref:hypothetical protein n=1 Tax=Klebsiella pasteurii TaxID=2587529 RepID=UPI00292A7AFC|nr:hypothetical protein [Klebsiella michiganensis]HEJ8623024.1 hypothetical protein [Klebsiella michiganensis]